MQRSSGFTAAVVLAVSLMTGCDTGVQLAPQEHLQRARDFYAKGEIAANIIELKNALQQEPDLAEARWLLGKAYLDLGDGAAAADELERARRLGFAQAQHRSLTLRALLLQQKYQEVLDQTGAKKSQTLSPGELQLRGEALLGLSRLREAKEIFDRVLTSQPDSLDAKFGLARIALAEGKLDRAEDLIRAALKASPDNAQALVLEGERLLRKNAIQAAQEAFRKAIADRRYGVLAKIGLARALIAQDKLDEGGAVLESLDKQAKNSPLAHYLTAQIAQKKNDDEKARQELRDALRLAPDHPESLLLLASLHFKEGNLEQAEQLLIRFTKKLPSYLPAVKFLAVILMQQGRLQAAIDTLQDLAHQGRADPQLLALLGSAYLKRGDVAKGAPLLEQAAQLAPEAADIRTELALSHLATGASEQAISEFESVIKLDKRIMRADLLLVLAHLQRKDYNQAMAAAQGLAQKEPDNPIAYNVMGTALLGKSDTAAARKQWEQALKQDPKFVPAMLNLAALEMREQHPDIAETRYHQVLEHDESSVQALIALAKVAADRGDAEETTKRLEQARERNPTALQPRLILARYYLERKKGPSALSVTEEARTLAPDDPEALLLLGRSQLATGNAHAAKETLKRLVELQPEWPQAHFDLALAYGRLAEDDLAKAALERVLKLKSDFLSAEIALAWLELRAHHSDKALAIADGLVKKHPESPQVHALRGQALSVQGKFKQAVASYEAAFARDRGPLMAINLHAVKLQSGDRAGAYAVLEQWLKEHPNDITVRLQLAGTRQHHGEAAPAIAEYQRVLATQPQNVLALNNLAWLYHEAGDNRALDFAQQAYEQAPKSPLVMDTLGWILVQQGNIERGLELLEKAAYQAPKLGDIRYHLAAALARAGSETRARNELAGLLDSGDTFSGREQAKKLYEQLK
ncbi:MAG: XrtA/PEP-CTERM system TPR-repeat protein PrsT [Gammaproteobacteria bacterium]